MTVTIIASTRRTVRSPLLNRYSSSSAFFFRLDQSIVEQRQAGWERPPLHKTNRKFSLVFVSMPSIVVFLFSPRSINNTNDDDHHLYYKDDGNGKSTLIIRSMMFIVVSLFSFRSMDNDDDPNRLMIFLTGVSLCWTYHVLNIVGKDEPESTFDDLIATELSPDHRWI